MTEYRFIEPYDTLFFRGNRLFGEAPGGGEALMPPWPSAFAGALRSAMLAHAGVAPADVANGRLEGALADCLGSVTAPGAFTLSGVTLAECSENGLETFHPLPADMVIHEDPTGITVQRLQPVPLPAGIASSASSARLPVAQAAERGKPLGGYWLTGQGWARYLRGETPGPDEIRHQNELWQSDPRLGIALDSTRRRAAEGQLYTTEGIRLARNVGFLVTVDGVPEGLLPGAATLRLGGDGGSARMASIDPPPGAGADNEALHTDNACRVVLTSPGLFPDGWQLPGAADGSWPALSGAARITAAAVPRATTVSGWDLAQHRPKPAQRCAPAGSVYWLEGIREAREALRKIANEGLWHLTSDNVSSSRRAEGFNRCVIANA